MKYLTVLRVLPLLLLSSCTALAPVDLSSWIAEGPGSWSLETRLAANDSVFQSANNSPSVFYDPSESAQGTRLTGTIEVTQHGDDDFIGFVLGYRAGDLRTEAPDYLVVDWKREDQDYRDLGLARAGLAISRVTVPLYEAAGPWSHDTSDGVEELARGKTLGRKGYQQDREYSFEITFTATRVTVAVDGVVELDVAGDFPDGAFGFYNYSQPNVRYAGIQTARLLPVPVWLLWLLLAVVLLATIALLRRRRAQRAS